MHGQERPEAPAPVAADPFALGTPAANPVFPASFESRCAADDDCRADYGLILEGDLIQAIGPGEFAHEECARA